MANFTPQEIEEMLQEFFDTVGKRQYVGARYVPIFGRRDEDTVEWNSLAPYEPLTVVMHHGISYVSKRYVPKDIDITNTDYWVETYRFNAQVEQYRQEVLQFQSQINQIREDMESDYVPFPDSATYPKYGTLGQVLTTLTGGETKWEDPVVPSDEQAEAIITEWLNAHPEATTTVQDNSLLDSKLKHAYNNILSNAIQTDITIYNSTSVQAPYDNVDTFPINKCVFINNTEGGIANCPVEGYEGYILTINYRGNFPNSGNNYNRTHTIQLAFRTSTDLYGAWIRVRYNSWGAWHPLDGLNEGTVTDIYLSHAYNNILSNAIQGVTTICDSTNVEAPYDNLDTFPNNRCILINNTQGGIANCPVRGFEGYVLTMNYRGNVPQSGLPYNRSHTVQLATITSNDMNGTWVRVKYSNWSQWRRIDSYQGSAFMGLLDFDVLGDSISVSLSYPNAQTEVTVESWAKIMAKDMVGTSHVYAAGGRTTAGMLAAADYQDVVTNADDNQFAIICLGINDINQDVTDSDFTTNYTRLVTDMLTNHKFVLCSKIPHELQSSDRVTTFNGIIANICANTANAFVVDPNAYSTAYKSYVYLGHLSSVGYAAFATAMKSAINDTMNSNAYFKSSGVDS